MHLFRGEVIRVTFNHCFLDPRSKDPKDSCFSRTGCSGKVREYLVGVSGELNVNMIKGIRVVMLKQQIGVVSVDTVVSVCHVAPIQQMDDLDDIHQVLQYIK